MAGQAIDRFGPALGRPGTSPRPYGLRARTGKASAVPDAQPNVRTRHRSVTSRPAQAAQFGVQPWSSVRHRQTAKRHRAVKAVRHCAPSWTQVKFVLPDVGYHEFYATPGRKRLRDPYCHVCTLTRPVTRRRLMPTAQADVLAVGSIGIGGRLSTFSCTRSATYSQRAAAEVDMTDSVRQAHYRGSGTPHDER